MKHSNFADVCNVPHFHVYEQFSVPSGYISPKIKTQNQLFKEFDDYSQPLARAFSLCAIHEAMNYIS